MTPRSWRCRDHTLELGRRALLMGIVNVTPDSFSDGGAFAETDDAVKHALQLLADEADMIDVGGESTRPGSEPVPEADELARVVPVIERLHAEAPDAPISVDTRKPAVAAAAIAAGAAIVNDVDAAAAPGMLELVRDTGAGLVLMHMLDDPKTMQRDPRYDDVVGEVRGFLARRIGAAVASGIPRDRLCVDPGIGFGKTLDHNLELLRAIGSFHELGVPVLVGVSRKRFIGELTGAIEPSDRLEGTAGAVAWCAAQGVDILRVHDVKEMAKVVRVVDAIVRGGGLA
ncbi:MAG: dihydropteroate synthase [Actinomycetota bacterium]|nr:dihydropteroate synthase [Actinomycetota bacterium]